MEGGGEQVEEPEQKPAPPVSSLHRLPPPAHPRPSDEGEEDAAANESTSPFPYAEKFDEWVADETAASDGRRHRCEGGDADDQAARTCR